MSHDTKPLAPSSTAKAEMKCDCGAPFNSIGCDWRFNGRRWEHYHGYPVGHSEVAGSENWLDSSASQEGK